MLVIRLSKRLVRNLSSLGRRADERQQDRAARQICSVLLTADTNKESALSSIKCRLSHRLVAQVVRLVKDVNPDAVVCFLFWAAQYHGFVANSISYSELVVSLARAFNFSAMWKVMEEMDRLSYVISPAVLATVIRCYGRANMPEEAVSALDKMQNRHKCKPSEKTYKALVSVLVSAGHLCRALSVYRDMVDKGLVPNAPVCATILHGVCLAGKAGDFIRQLGASGWNMDANVYNTLIRGYIGKRRYQDAYKTFQEIHNTSEAVNSVTYELVLCGCAKSGSQVLVEAGVDVYEEMVSRSYVAGAGVIRSLVYALVESNRTKEAGNVLMRGGRVDVVTYTLVVDGLCKRGDCEQALELVRVMRTSSVTPNVVTYSSLIDGLCKAGKMEAAVKSFEEMQAAGCTPNTYTYNSLIHGLCMSERLEDAFTLLRVMKGKGCEPSLTNKNTLMNGICKQIIAEWRKRQFGKRGQRLFQEEVSRSVAAEESKISLLYAALEYMFGTGDHVPDQCTYSIVIHFLCKVQKVVEAARVWNAMRRKLEQVDVVTYNSFLYGLVQLRNVDEATRLFREIQSPSLVSHSLLLDAFFKEGDFTGGHHVYEEMERQGWSPDVVVYNILINGLCKASLETQGTRVAEVWADMLNSGISPSVTTYSILIHAVCSQGRLDAAMDILKKMKERGCIPHVVTYNTVLDGLCRNEFLDEALKLFREMKRSCGHTPATWNIILDGILRAGDLASAEAVFLELLRDGLFPNCVTYDTLVDRILEVQSDPPSDQQQQQQQQQQEEGQQEQSLLSFSYSRVVDFFLD